MKSDHKKSRRRYVLRNRSVSARKTSCGQSIAPNKSRGKLAGSPLTAFQQSGYINMSGETKSIKGSCLSTCEHRANAIENAGVSRTNEGLSKTEQTLFWTNGGVTPFLKSLIFIVLDFLFNII